MRLETVSLLFVFGFCGLVWATEAANPVPPIKTYRRGYKQRVEYIKAVISRVNLDKGSAPSSKARAYSKSMSPYKNDDAGHLIAARLGGTGKETYNIVPQNLAQNRGVWRTRVEAPIYAAVKQGAIVTYEVWPQYSGNRATRPSSLRYMAKKKNGRIVVSGTVPNPIPARLESYEFDSLPSDTQNLTDYFEILANRTYVMEQNNELNENDEIPFASFSEKLNLYFLDE